MLRRAVRAALPALFAPLVLPWSLPAVAAAPTCNGLEATIVVPARQTRVDGTDGDDVIVSTAGSHVVLAGAGNDTVCTSAGTDDIYPGPGDDWVSPGDGADTLWDSPGSDVLGGSTQDLFSTDFAGHAVVNLAAGTATGIGQADITYISNFRQIGPGSATVVGNGYTSLIQTGSGPSNITTSKQAWGDSGLSIVTGAGIDEVFVRRPDTFVATNGGLDTITVTSTTGVTRIDDQADGVTVTGGPAVEEVTAEAPKGATGPVHLDLGGGDDVVAAGSTDLEVATGDGDDRVGVHHIRFAPNTGWVRLGAGNDYLLMEALVNGRMPQRVDGQSGRDTVVGTLVHDVIDLRSDAYRESGSSYASVIITQFEAANGQGSSDLLTGTDTSNVLRGGAGNDTLKGGSGDDVLLGGPDRDQAYGGPGSDRCVAEVRRSCER